jgi:hypothetical protein
MRIVLSYSGDVFPTTTTQPVVSSPSSFFKDQSSPIVVLTSQQGFEKIQAQLKNITFNNNNDGTSHQQQEQHTFPHVKVVVLQQNDDEELIAADQTTPAIDDRANKIDLVKMMKYIKQDLGVEVKKKIGAKNPCMY